MDKMKPRKRLTQVLVNRDTEIAEILIKLFSLRLLVILSIPSFRNYLLQATENSPSDLTYPWHLIILVIISLGTWCYGFFRDKFKWRKIGMAISMYMHTFLAIGLALGSAMSGVWMIYLILGIISAVIYVRMRRGLIK